MIYNPKVDAEIKITIKSNKVLTEKQLHTIILTLEQRLNSSNMTPQLIEGIHVGAHITGLARFHFKDIKHK